MAKNISFGCAASKSTLEYPLAESSPLLLPDLTHSYMYSAIPERGLRLKRCDFGSLFPPFPLRSQPVSALQKPRYSYLAGLLRDEKLSLLEDYTFINGWKHGPLADLCFAGSLNVNSHTELTKPFTIPRRYSLSKRNKCPE